MPTLKTFYRDVRALIQRKAPNVTFVFHDAFQLSADMWNDLFEDTDKVFCVEFLQCYCSAFSVHLQCYCSAFAALLQCYCSAFAVLSLCFRSTITVFVQ
jgi:hypothetical protein